MIEPLPSDRFGDEDIVTLYPERANLFPLEVQPLPTVLYLIRRTIGRKTRGELHFDSREGAEVIVADARRIRWALQDRILKAIGDAGYRISRKRFRPIVYDARSNFAPKSPIRIYSSFELQVTEFGDHLFLCLDHRLRVHANLSLQSLMQ